MSRESRGCSTRSENKQGTEHELRSQNTEVRTSPSPLIIESIVTTTTLDGTINVAPMGVEWGDERIVLKPFLDTATYRNVTASGIAVVNLTDDVRIFARAAISNPQPPTLPADTVAGVRLAAACSWRELTVESIDSTPPRARIVGQVVHRGVHREFIGFNRARHAVLETAIYATRIHLLPRDLIESEVERLQTIVDKTASAVEHEAMDLLTSFIRERLRPSSAVGAES
jgi:hypothetical protein